MQFSANKHESVQGPQDRGGQFVRLLSGCERRLYRYVFSLVGRVDDADEIIQETLVRLWEQFDQFQPEADFGGWACTVAFYQVLSFRKRASRDRLQLTPEFYEAISTELTTASADLEARRSALAECLASLAAWERDLVVGCYSEGTPIKRIAAGLGRTVGATYQALWRVRNKLHRCIDLRLTTEGRP